ncbi:MAG: hypothetical protein R2755_26450 [Acidimicrobiales bacterium]
MSGLLARRLRVRRHQATTAHLCSIYPFQTAGPLPGHGLLHGINVLAGGSPFRFDPFDAYQSGLITNPNMLIAGEPGVGKSATAKAFIYRSVGVLGRWVAIADPRASTARWPMLWASP